MLKTECLKQYLSTTARNRIVFCSEGIDGITFLNVGYRIAKLLQEDQKIHELFSLFTEVNEDSVIGKYLAIENIGILFEPELKLDLRSLFNHYSKNQCLIVRTEAKIENDTLYFLDTSDNVSINLQGLSYTII